MADYDDDDLVYVDPKTKSVVGKVEWGNSGNPKPLQRKDDDDDGEGSKGKKPRRKRFYPWGTYKSMKRLFQIEGKVIEPESNPLSLDEAITKAMKEPYWD